RRGGFRRRTLTMPSRGSRDIPVEDDRTTIIHSAVLQQSADGPARRGRRRAEREEVLLKDTSAREAAPISFPSSSLHKIDQGSDVAQMLRAAGGTSSGGVVEVGP